MRVILDTNVLVAAFISRGVCHDLFEHLVRQHTIVSSEFILEEFRRVLVEKVRVPERKADAAAALIRDQAVLVSDAPLDENICRDPDDDWILSAAASSKSECIISGDADLLTLGTFQGILILKPSDFWEHETRRAGEE